MKIVSTLSRSHGKFENTHFFFGGVTVTKTEKDGKTEYVLDGTAFKMTEKQANFFRRHEKDEETAAAKQYYILFGLVVEPGEKVELRSVETGGSCCINNKKKDEDISEGVIADVGPGPGGLGLGLEGTFTDRDGNKSEFEVVPGEIVFKDRIGWR